MQEPQPDCLREEHASEPVIGPVDEGNCERASAIFRALGDFNRLRILMMLQADEMCVTAIAQELDDNLSAVSQRLKLLRSERVITSRREGKHVYYSLADECIAELVNHALKHVSESPGSGIAIS